MEIVIREGQKTKKPLTFRDLETGECGINRFGILRMKTDEGTLVCVGCEAEPDNIGIEQLSHWAAQDEKLDPNRRYRIGKIEVEVID